MRNKIFRLITEVSQDEQYMWSGPNAYLWQVDRMDIFNIYRVVNYLLLWADVRDCPAIEHVAFSTPGCGGFVEMPNENLIEDCQAHCEPHIFNPKYPLCKRYDQWSETDWSIENEQLHVSIIDGKINDFFYIQGTLRKSDYSVWTEYLKFSTFEIDVTKQEC